MFKYGKAFAGADPTLMEDDLFHSEFSLESTIFNDIGISGAPINDAIRAPENETINETIKNSPGISLLGLVARTKKEPCHCCKDNSKNHLLGVKNHLLRAKNHLLTSCWHD